MWKYVFHDYSISHKWICKHSKEVVESVDLQSNPGKNDIHPVTLRGTCFWSPELVGRKVSPEHESENKKGWRHTIVEREIYPMSISGFVKTSGDRLYYRCQFLAKSHSRSWVQYRGESAWVHRRGTSRREVFGSGFLLVLFKIFCLSSMLSVFSFHGIKWNETWLFWSSRADHLIRWIFVKYFESNKSTWIWWTENGFP